jgi:selenide,water dikinase
MKTLNAAAQRAMVRVGARGATDITGFGLLGHLYEMAAASGVSVTVDAAAVPFLPGALRYAENGVNTGGGRGNARYLGERVRFSPAVPEAIRVACFDPQTSGGLLIAVPEARTAELLAELEREGVPVRAAIGRVGTGEPGIIEVRA